MGQLLDQAYETFSEEARRRSIDYRQEARDRPVIVSDGDRVLQIVGNLLSNAFRATPDGGRITLELGADERHRERDGRRLGAGDLSRRSRSGCSARSSPRAAAARGSASRSRRSCRRRSAAGSRSTRRWGAARGSSSSCRYLAALGGFGAGQFDGLVRRSAGGCELAACRCARGSRFAMSSCSIRASRTFIERQPSVSSSTRSARSSMRALRSESSVASIRSRRRIELLCRPLTSARRREIGDAVLRGGRRGARRERCSPSAATERPPLSVDASVRVGWTPAELDYDLPPELIAQQPLAAARRLAAARLRPRDAAMCGMRRCAICPASFPPGTLTVVNDSRVVPARIPIEQPRGEVLLLERARRRRVGGARAADPPAAAGQPVPDRLRQRRAASLISARAAGGCGSRASRPAACRCRRTSPRRSPTPSATRRSTPATPGSAAAPTAGLHFTPELLGLRRQRAGDAPRRPRHVPAAAGGAGRGAPDPRRALRGDARGAGSGSAAPAACWPSARRRCAWWRRSPTAARSRGARSSSSRPGFEFRRVDHLLTNFHLPRSTLLALVMAFAGRRGDQAPVRARDRGALPLLLVRRRDADPVTCKLRHTVTS